MGRYKRKDPLYVIWNITYKIAASLRECCGNLCLGGVGLQIVLINRVSEVATSYIFQSSIPNHTPVSVINLNGIDYHTNRVVTSTTGKRYIFLNHTVWNKC